jgi:hypothetical protein
MLLGRESGEVEIGSHHLLFLAEPGRLWSGRDAGRDGFLSAEVGVLCLFTGIAAGPVHVIVEQHDEPPPLDEADPPWEDLDEVDWSARTGEARFTTFASEATEIGAVTPPYATTYRVRVRARGRNDAYDWTVDEVTEYYLIQFWHLEPFDEPDDDYEQPRLPSPVRLDPPARQAPPVR